MFTTSEDWVKTRDAEKILCISERSLLRLRKNKTLLAGTCWRRTIPNNLNSHIIYNIHECLEILNGISKATEMEVDLLAKDEKLEVIEE